jgi:hypothetical protein
MMMHILRMILTVAFVSGCAGTPEGFSAAERQRQLTGQPFFRVVLDMPIEKVRRCPRIYSVPPVAGSTSIWPRPSTEHPWIRRGDPRMDAHATPDGRTVFAAYPENTTNYANRQLVDLIFRQLVECVHMPV